MKVRAFRLILGLLLVCTVSIHGQSVQAWANSRTLSAYQNVEILGVDPHPSRIQGHPNIRGSIEIKVQNILDNDEYSSFNKRYTSNSIVDIDGDRGLMLFNLDIYGYSGNDPMTNTNARIVYDDKMLIGGAITIRINRAQIRKQMDDLGLDPPSNPRDIRILYFDYVSGEWRNIRDLHDTGDIFVENWNAATLKIRVYNWPLDDRLHVGI